MPFEPRCLVRAALLATALALAAIDAVEALASLGAQIREARRDGLELAVALGDVAIRDVPKALTIRHVGFFADPHYAGEPHWYPFMTPLLAAGVSAALGLPINHAYFATGAILGALSLVALALLLRSWGGSLGLVVLPAAVLAGLVWPEGGTYPYATSQLPFTLFMLAAGAIFAADGDRGRPLGPAWLFLAGGAAQGVLGIWHGSSFLTASAVAAVVLVKLAVGALRSPDGRRARVARIAAWVAPVIACLALLIGPQLLHYGTFRQADAARLWLLESTFGAGDRPGDLFRLALLPRGWGALWLLAFAATFAVAREHRRRAVPLAIGWAAAKGVAHLGFVLNSPDHPWLAAAARRLLLAPPHTLDGVAEYASLLMKLWTVVAALAWIAGRAPVRAAIDRALARVPRLGPEAAREALALVAALALTAAVAGSPPPVALLHVQLVDAAVPRFAEGVRALLAPGDAVVGGNALVRLVAVRILAAGSPAHANPYVHGERAAAARALEEAAARGDWDAAGAILERYRIRLAIGDGPLARGCATEIVLRSPDGIPVFRLAPRCGAVPVPQVPSVP